ncbi:DEAD/DEAH box helicase [Aquihabitans daechungensis]|uniref:DEAD/DEAH box helicase n=1 Tax=Aquihabitans daechungensis TaxID=1052257 RepID=UPI003BA14D4D
MTDLPEDLAVPTPDDDAVDPVDAEPVPEEETTGFAELGLRPEILGALNTLGYEEPTPIQRETIPPIISGRDLLGQAATGTGKTAAFALPILERIVVGATAEPIALVLVPTRELAVQVSEAIYKYGRELDAHVLPIYGGQPIVHQLKVLKRGVHVVVATPGRAVDHINRGTLPLDAVELVVLDEADEMLDMGFAEDIDAILDACPFERQTVLFSATMPSRIASIAKRHLKDPVRIQVNREAVAAGEAPRVRQSAYLVARSHKAAALGRILDVESPTAAIVFCKTRGEVDELTETLNGRGYRAEALHGGMNQEQRDRVMARLRSGTAELLVATDVAARGLDVDQLTHVVNFDVPSAPESYVHRIGRVGRAGREGVAITLAEPRQRRLLDNIERLTKQTIKIEKIPTVADLRARQMELTLDQVREALESDDLQRFRAVVDALSDEFELVDVALAAVKLVHEASGATEDVEEIPDIATRDKHAGKGKNDKWDKGSKGKGGKSWDKDKPGKGYQGKKDRDDRGPREPRGPQGDTSRLYVGAGRGDGVRPQDLVGAIAGETHLRGNDIGAIRIFDRFALVEVPTDAVDRVIDAMKATTIRGKKAAVRKDRGDHD